MMKQMTLVNNKKAGKLSRASGFYGKRWGALLVLLALCGGGSLHAQTPDFAWATQIGGSKAEVAYGLSSDAAGNVYTNGRFSSPLTFGSTTLTPVGTSNDGFVAKQDDQGNFLWVTQLSATKAVNVYGTAEDHVGNVYVTGYFQGNATMGSISLPSHATTTIFVAKLSPTGQVEWANSYGASGYNAAYSIAVDNKGNVYNTGYYQSTTDFDPANPGQHKLTATIQNAYILSLDTSGNFRWVKDMKGGYRDYGRAVTVDGAGYIYASGYFGSGSPSSKSGSFGSITLATKGNADVYVAKLDAQGNFSWARRMGGAQEDGNTSVAADDSGNVYLTGWTASTNADFGNTTIKTNGSDDIFITKLDSTGKFVWAKSMGGTGVDRGNGIAVDGSGNVYTTGQFNSSDFDADPGAGDHKLTMTGTQDIYLHGLDAHGDFIWAGNIGASGKGSNGLGITISGDALYAAGLFEGAKTDFNVGTGTSLLSSKGSYDAYTVKYDLPKPLPTNSIDVVKLDPMPKYCRNSPVKVAYTATGTYNSGNVFTAQLSDANGDFTNATDIGTLTGTAASGVIDATISATALTGTAYRIRVVSSNPSVTGSDNGTDLSVNGGVNLALFSINSIPDPPTICEGEEVTLQGVYTSISFGTRPSYSWDNGIANNKAFTPSTTTTYTLTATSGGCTTTRQITVTVIPKPDVTAVSKPDPAEICEGESIMLDYIAGLTAHQMNYSWDKGVSNNTPFKPTQTETYTITAKDITTGCQAKDSVKVVVHPSPTVTAAAKPGTDICEGNEVTLNGGGADTYDWNHSVTDGKAFVPAQTETYTVTGTDANGCVDSADITITVKDTSVVAASDTICSGDTYTFGTQTLDKTGTYTEVFVAANGCDSTVHLALTVNTVDLSIAQNGNELKATDGATSYQWLDCNNGKQPIPGATNQTYTSNDGGDFAVVVTSGGCTDTSVCYHIEGMSGIHGTNFSRQMTLYPNPNNGQMTVASGNALHDATVRVINVIGQTVMTQEHVSGNSFRIDIRQYAAGIYYVEIRDGAQTARVKFTKE